MSAAEAGGPPGLMSVRAELVRDHLVGGMRSAVRSHEPARIPAELKQGMTNTFDLLCADRGGTLRAEPDAGEARIVAAKVASLGYTARLCEVEMFEPARRPATALVSALAARESYDGAEPFIVSEAARLARAEPEKRPDPADGTASWQIPGPGGHVRHYVAVETVAEHCERDPGGVPAAPLGVGLADLKRAWMFGFILCALAELEAEQVS